MNRFDDKRLDTVVFVCVATAKAPRRLRALQKALRRYRGQDTPVTDWEAQVATALERSDGMPGEMAQAARRELGLDADLDWERAREGVLPMRALGIATEDFAGSRKRLGRANGWAAAIVARSQGLWIDGPPPTAARLCDQLVWQALGLRGSAERTPDAIRGHFLRQKLRTAGGEGRADRWLRQLAAQTVGGTSTDVGDLRNALVTRWISGVPLESQATPSPPDAKSTPEDFVGAVHDAARRAHDGRFGERQVFIVSVWRKLRGHPVFGGLSLDEFKHRLIVAHRAGELALVRADLIGVMDPALVAESEINHLEARYHFLLEEAA